MNAWILRYDVAPEATEHAVQQRVDQVVAFSLSPPGTFTVAKQSFNGFIALSVPHAGLYCFRWQ